jgi:RimJ/RimL family protein N-acetyltransferase
MSVVTLRRATAADSELFFVWVNQPDSLAGKLLTKKEISRHEHEAWFAAHVADADCFMWIIEVGAKPAGQIRIAPRDASHEIDIYLDAAYRRGGVAHNALKQAITLFAAVKTGRRLNACVKNNNMASQGLFERAGFALTARHGDHMVYSLQPPSS